MSESQIGYCQAQGQESCFGTKALLPSTYLLTWFLLNSSSIVGVLISRIAISWRQCLLSVMGSVLSELFLFSCQWPVDSPSFLCSGNVSHLTDHKLTIPLFFSHLVVSFYKLELCRWERLRGQVMTEFVVVVDCDQLTRLPAISIFNQLFLVPLFPTIQDIGRDKMPGGSQPLSHWKSIKCHSF